MKRTKRYLAFFLAFAMTLGVFAVNIPARASAADSAGSATFTQTGFPGGDVAAPPPPAGAQDISANASGAASSDYADYGISIVDGADSGTIDANSAAGWTTWGWFYNSDFPSSGATVQTPPEVIFSGNWGPYYSPGNRDELTTSTPGDYYEINFTGTGIECTMVTMDFYWLWSGANICNGTMDVYIDDMSVPAATVNLNDFTGIDDDAYSCVVYSDLGLADGTHKARFQLEGGAMSFANLRVYGGTAFVPSGDGGGDGDDSYTDYSVYMSTDDDTTNAMLAEGWQYWGWMWGGTDYWPTTLTPAEVTFSPAPYMDGSSQSAADLSRGWGTNPSGSRPEPQTRA
ncbi:MAG: hypothetical protein FWF44_11890, partial [Defluviitaleaceae bacterium]|nr:hypothetical protein [Defluviitaleaceae bacterium]